MRLDLEQLDHLGALVGGGHQLQAVVLVREQQTGRACLDEVGRVRGQHLEELDQVEVVHQGVGHLDEHLGQPLR